MATVERIILLELRYFVGKISLLSSYLLLTANGLFHNVHLQVCGADIAIALDMSRCEAETWERMAAFVNHLVDEVKLDQTLGGERNTGRVAVMLFSRIDQKSKYNLKTL